MRERYFDQIVSMLNGKRCVIIFRMMQVHVLYVIAIVNRLMKPTLEIAEI